MDDISRRDVIAGGIGAGVAGLGALVTTEAPPVSTFGVEYERLGSHGDAPDGPLVHGVYPEKTEGGLVLLDDPDLWLRLEAVSPSATAFPSAEFGVMSTHLDTPVGGWASRGELRPGATLLFKLPADSVTHRTYIAHDPADSPGWGVYGRLTVYRDRPDFSPKVAMCYAEPANESETTTDHANQTQDDG